MSKQWFIGTSGFMVSQKQWLEMPGLNCIEMNSTFYKLPSAKTVQKWKNTSPNLYFSIKVSKYITHMKRLKNCKQAWKVFWNRIKPLGNKLKALLIQLPPSFKNNEINLQRVKDMASYLPKSKISIVFEFRDNSWFVPEVYKVMKKYNLCLGGTSIKRPTKRYWLGDLPTGTHIPPKTSDTTYLRIHGEKGYRKSYSNQELSVIKKQILKNKTSKNFIMFNNTFFAKRNKTCKIRKKKVRYAAVCDAVQFAKMTRKRLI